MFLTRTLSAKETLGICFLAIADSSDQSTRFVPRVINFFGIRLVIFHNRQSCLPGGQNQRCLPTTKNSFSYSKRFISCRVCPLSPLPLCFSTLVPPSAPLAGTDKNGEYCILRDHFLHGVAASAIFGSPSWRRCLWGVEIRERYVRAPVSSCRLLIV